MARFIRANHDLPKCGDYTRFRPYLREDFRFQCAYCGMTEASVFGIETFGVDHFRPKKLFPQLAFVYDSLYYCCNDCNRYKGPAWPSPESAAKGYFFPDPCECDPQLDHLKECQDCRWEASSNAGVFSLEVMRFNRESCLRFDSIEPEEIRDLRYLAGSMLRMAAMCQPEWSLVSTIELHIFRVGLPAASINS
jgi:hypothetical protein